VYPQEEMDGFEHYWRRRKPGRSTPIHYRSDVNISLRWVQQSPASITVHHIDQFIDWQRGLGRAPAARHAALWYVWILHHKVGGGRKGDGEGRQGKRIWHEWASETGLLVRLMCGFQPSGCPVRCIGACP
jgi:hypothetical protein